jgi:hypothetical protein
MARAALDIDSLSATLEAIYLEAIYSVLGKMGDFRNRRGEKHLRPAQCAPGRLDYISFFPLNREVRGPRR